MRHAARDHSGGQRTEHRIHGEEVAQAADSSQKEYLDRGEIVPLPKARSQLIGSPQKKWCDNQGGDDRKYRRGDMIGRRPRAGWIEADESRQTLFNVRLGLHQAQRDSDHQIEHHIVDNCRGNDDSSERRLEDVQIHHDPRDHRNAGDGNRGGEDQQEGE